MIIAVRLVLQTRWEMAVATGVIFSIAFSVVEDRPSAFFTLTHPSVSVAIHVSLTLKLGHDPITTDCVWGEQAASRSGHLGWAVALDKKAKLNTE